MLKKYWERDLSEETVNDSVQELNAVVVEADEEIYSEIDCTESSRRKLTMLRLARI